VVDRQSLGICTRDPVTACNPMAFDELIVGV